MRIPSATICLMAGPLAQVVTAQVSGGIPAQNRVLNFDDANFQIQDSPEQETDAAVFDISSPSLYSQKEFQWTTSADTPISVVSIALVVDGVPIGFASNGNTGNSGNTGSSITTSQHSIPSLLSVASEKMIRSFAAEPRDGAVLITLNATGTLVPQGSVTVDFNQFGENTNPQYFGEPMYFTVTWISTGTNLQGNSSSRKFTVVPGLQELANLEGSFTNPDPAATEYVPTGAFPSSTTVGGAAATSTATGSSGNSNVMPSGLTASAVASSSHSGLSTGAIAGIACGCVVIALTLIGILVWFLVRRRRDGAGGGGRGGGARSPVPYITSSRTQELMAEKEANAGVTETPHSPYSDDGHGGGGETAMAVASGAGTAAAAHRYHQRDQQNGSASQPYTGERSFTPYLDRPFSVPAHGAGGVAGAVPAEEQRHSLARSPTPQGISTRYAHLVEEGMTEDEIRRLEDEERQLDAAIEQAGRGP